MWQRFTEPARAAIIRSQAIAESRQGDQVESGHLCLALLEENAGNEKVLHLLKMSGVPVEEVRLYVESTLPPNPKIMGRPQLTPGAKKILELAVNEARMASESMIGVTHLFIACVRQQRGDHLGQVLRPLGLDAQALRRLARSGEKRAHKVVLFDFMTKRSRQTLDNAEASMRASFCGQISTSHLLLGLCELDDPREVTHLLTPEGGIEEFKRAIKESIVSDHYTAGPQRKFSPAAKRALERAKGEANALGTQAINPNHLLLGLLPSPSTLAEKIAFGVALDDPLERFWKHWLKHQPELYIQQLRAHVRRFADWKPLPLTEGTEKIMARAHEEASASGSDLIGNLNIIHAILHAPDCHAFQILQEAGCDMNELEEKTGLPQFGAPLPTGERKFSHATQWTLAIANQTAAQQRMRFIDSSHILTGLFSSESQRPEETIVPFLTPQQIEAIERKLEQLAPPSGEGPAKSRLPAKAWSRSVAGFGVSSFLSTFLCVAVAESGRGTPGGSSAAAVFILLLQLVLFGLGVIFTQLLGYSPRIKASALSLFSGCLLGTLGAYVVVILSSR